MHCDWCRAWLDAMNYTHSLCHAETYTYTGTHTHAQKGAERQRQRGPCCDDLGFSCLSSATALPLKGAAQISHAGAHTQTPTHHTYNHVSQLQKNKQKGGVRENKREMYTTGIEKGEDLPPTQSPFSLSPPTANITRSLLLSLIFPCFLLYFQFFPSALMQISNTFPSIFYPYTKMSVFSPFFHFVRVGNKLFAPTPTMAVWWICQTHIF